MRRKKTCFSETFEDTVLQGLGAFFSGKHDKRLALLALSGGADSTAMTAAMAAIRGRTARVELHALHVNHGIRPPDACAADETAARDLCNQLDIPFSVKTIPPGTVDNHARQYGTGIEGAARFFRYQALLEEAARLGADALLTAHTSDDRLETILMAFLRGVGPSGLGALTGLSVESDIGTSPIPQAVIRPLLSLSRMDVLAYAKERNLVFCSDETNEDQRFFRNKIRSVLVPFLDKQFPYWRNPVLRLGDTQALASTFLKKEAEKLLRWETDTGVKCSCLSIPAGDFFSAPEILREEALFLAMNRLNPNTELTSTEYSGKKPRRETIRSFALGKVITADIGQFRLEDKKGRITIKKIAKQQCKCGFSVLIKTAGVYKLNNITILAGMQPDNALCFFYAAYPLALYTMSEEKIIAEDRHGKAAVIQKNSVAWKREKMNENNRNCFSINVNGGSNTDGS